MAARATTSKFHKISELNTFSKDDLQGLYVRTIGYLLSHDCVHCTLTIKDGSDVLRVNTKYIEPFPFRAGSLYLFIGEMEKDWERDAISFSPKVYRCVDGLNVQLYHKVREERDQSLLQESQTKH